MRISDRVNNKQHECTHKWVAGVTAASRLRHDFTCKITKKYQRRMREKNSKVSQSSSNNSQGWCRLTYVICYLLATLRLRRRFCSTFVWNSNFFVCFSRPGWAFWFGCSVLWHFANFFTLLFRRKCVRSQVLCLLVVVVAGASVVIVVCWRDCFWANGYK